VREVDASGWEDAVLGAEVPVLVDFWAPWCRPCKAIRPILEQLEDEAGGSVAFAAVNIDEQPEIAARYEVLSIPTVIMFEGGEAKETLVGARPRSHFEQTFGAWLGT
jgi:thioredoxin